LNGAKVLDQAHTWIHEQGHGEETGPADKRSNKK